MTSIEFRKINIQLIFSGIFFLIGMFLDFYMTYTLSGGDPNLEANFLARLWWQVFGSMRFIEIPIWITVVFGMAYLINTKSEFLSILWLDFLGLNHFFGFLTWLPNSIIDFVYHLVKYDWATGYVLSLMSIIICFPVAIFQSRIIKNK